MLLVGPFSLLCKCLNPKQVVHERQMIVASAKQLQELDICTHFLEEKADERKLGKSVNRMYWEQAL